MCWRSSKVQRRKALLIHLIYISTAVYEFIHYNILPVVASYMERSISIGIWFIHLSEKKTPRLVSRQNPVLSTTFNYNKEKISGRETQFLLYVLELFKARIYEYVVLWSRSVYWGQVQLLYKWANLPQLCPHQFPVCGMQLDRTHVWKQWTQWQLAQTLQTVHRALIFQQHLWVSVTNRGQRHFFFLGGGACVRAADIVDK